MEERFARLEARLDELTASLKALEARLSGLEAGSTSGSSSSLAGAAEGPSTRAAGDDSWVASLPLLGRSLLVLGGAFLIRALTDGGTLPRGAGIALGLGYAVAWILAADRLAGRERRLSAVFFGSTAVFIASPLALEGATRFGAFPASAAAALLAGFTGLCLIVAWRRDLPVLAWVSTLATVATLLVLLLTTYAVTPVSAALILLGAATVGLAYSRRRWHGLRWPVAVAADLVVALMTWLAGRPGGAPGPYAGLSSRAALLLALALPVVYLGSAALRTLARRREVSGSEAVQSVASLLIGLGGAAAVGRATGSGQLPLGIAGLLLAAACYAVAFAFVERRSETARNFHFYTSLALGLALYASGLLLEREPLSALWSALGLSAAALSTRFGRTTLRFHTVAYLAAAAIASGLAAAPFAAFLGAAKPGPPLSPWGSAALASSAACFAIFAAGAPRESPTRLPAFVAAVL